MKKRILLGIIAVLITAGMLFMLTGCGNENKNNQNNKNENIQNSISRTKSNIENVTMEVLPDTITRESVTILITDNNEKKGSCGEAFKVQKKTNNEWQNLEPISDMLTWTTIAYMPNENGQFKMSLNIKKCYGELSNGTYRIMKDYAAYNAGGEIYSNEFKIK